MQKFYSIKQFITPLAVVCLLALSLVLPLQARADSAEIKQCVKGVVDSAGQCAGSAAQTMAQSGAAITTALEFMAIYPGCVNDVLNLNWVTIGITGAVTGLGVSGLLPVNDAGQCTSAIYSVAALPIAQGVKALGLGGAGIENFLADQAASSFSTLAASVPMPSVGAPTLRDQLSCGCAVAATGKQVIEDIRQTIVLAKQTVKSCGAAASKAVNCGGQVLGGLVTDPLGTLGGVGAAVAEEVVDAINYIADGGCKNPTTVAFFEGNFAPHVSLTAYNDVIAADGTQLASYLGKDKELYDACFKYFDGCASGKTDANRRCQAARRGDAKFGNAEDLGGNGFYQRVRARRFEYEITRALYEVATPIYADVEAQLAAKRNAMPKNVRDTFAAVDRGPFQIGKILGVYSSSKNKKDSEMVFGQGTKMSWQGGSIGELMSQRAAEVGKEGSYDAPATNTRARAKQIAEEYSSTFEVANTAVKQVDADFFNYLNKRFVNGGCVVLAAGGYSCPDVQLYNLCVAAIPHVSQPITCEADWKKAGLKQMQQGKACNLLDPNAPKFNCASIPNADYCNNIFDKLAAGFPKEKIQSNSICQFDVVQAMADTPDCSKAGSINYSCKSVESNNTCQVIHKYGKQPENRCKIDTTTAMKGVCPLLTISLGNAAGGGQAGSGSVGTALSIPQNLQALSSYLCVTYPTQEKCQSIFKEANSSQSAIDNTCKVDVAKADQTAGEVAVKALSTNKSVCTNQGAVLTCPRDVQKARCSKQPYMKGCLLQRPPAYDALVKQAEQVRQMLQAGFDFKNEAATRPLPQAPNSAVRSAGAVPVAVIRASKDIPGITLASLADPLLFLNYDAKPGYSINKVTAALKAYFPSIILSSCNNSQNDEFGLSSDLDGQDALTLCIVPSLKVSQDFVQKAAEDKANSLIKLPSGGKAPAALIQGKIDARVNPADVAKGGVAESVQVQTAGVRTTNAGAPAAGIAGMGLPAVPGMGAVQAGVPAGGLSARQLGSAAGLGANLPSVGVGSALPAGVGGTQQAMMGQVAPPPPSPPVAGVPSPDASPARGAPSAPAAPAFILPPANMIAGITTPHQQLTNANCTITTPVRGLPASIPPADGAYTCPAGAAQTLCEGFIRSQPLLVKRCNQALPATR